MVVGEPTLRWLNSAKINSVNIFLNIILFLYKKN